MWMDIGILVFFVIVIIRGYNKGFGKTLAYLISWIAAIVGAYYLSKPLKEFLLKTEFIKDWFGSFRIDHLPKAFLQELTTGFAEICTGIISFILIIIVLKVLISFFMSMFSFVKRNPLVGIANKILGGAVGLIKGVVILWLVSLFVIPLIAAVDSTGLSNIFEQSHIITAIYEYNSLLNIY